MVTLVGGPPTRNGKTKNTIISHIFQLQGIPTYYNVQRAWVILGYRGKPKPAWPVFCGHMNAMWTFITPTDIRSRRVRAYILDALRALHCYSEAWNPRTSALALTAANFCDNPALPGLIGGAIVARWAAIPAPLLRGQAPDDATCMGQYFDLPTLCAPLSDAGNPNAVTSWQRYHPFQEFEAAPDGFVNTGFKAIPVPEGPEALWHCVSYWWGPGRIDPNGGCHGRSMMNHRDMKARLWVYFTRVLQDPTHPRWREYIRFQYRSTQSKEDYGQLSILRSLHCNQKEHGLACNSAIFDDVFFVLADYFRTQVVIFYWSPAWVGNPGPWAIGAPAVVLGPLQPSWPQTYNNYAYRSYGTKVLGRQQIFLVQRADSNHLDVAEFVPPPAPAAAVVAGPGPAPAAAPGLPPVKMWAAADTAPPGLPWRLPLAPGAPAPAAAPPIHILPPPVITPQYMPVAGAAAAAAFVPALPGTILDPDVMARFAAGRDIPGDMFVLPTAAVAALWPTYNQAPPVFPQPPVGGRNAHQIRFGPRPVGRARQLRVPPQLEDPILAYEDEEN